jgi:alkylation response protein AidB-like acyl-CoA dehydrogenase
VTDPDAGPHGLSALVVPLGTSGLSTGRDEELLGLRGSPTSELVFDVTWVRRMRRSARRARASEPPLAENTTELAAGYTLLSDSAAGYLEGDWRPDFNSGPTTTT